MNFTIIDRGGKALAEITEDAPDSAAKNPMRRPGAIVAARKLRGQAFPGENLTGDAKFRSLDASSVRVDQHAS